MDKGHPSYAALRGRRPEGACSWPEEKEAVQKGTKGTACLALRVPKKDADSAKKGEPSSASPHIAIYTAHIYICL